MSSIKIGIICLLQVLFVSLSYGQKVEELIGKSFNDTELQKFISSLTDDPVESFIPFRKSYLLSYKKDGVELEFNSDMSLYQVNLYDSGYTFGRYRQPLPYACKWKEDSISLQNRIGVMIPQAQNPFVKVHTSDKFNTNFYFRGGRLELIRIIANSAYILAQGPESLKLWGIRLLPDGKAVNGNVLDGEGVMVWGDNAASYEGNWSYGLPHGLGIYIDSFGNKYAGEFKLGFFWGAGSYVSTSYNYTYDGYFIMGKRHGLGIIKYGNGTSYNGEWDKDQMHGKGQYTMGTSYYYQGDMYNNAFHGKGILTTPDGYIKGKFKNGKPHGYCEQYGNQSGQTLSGNWIDGQKEGEFTLNAFGFDRKLYFEHDIEIVTPNSN